MAQATAAEVVKKWGGTYPAGWDATSVGNVCTQVGLEVISRASPSSWAVDAYHAEFENELAFRKVNYGNWEAGGRIGTPPPYPWDTWMREWFQSLLTDTTYDSVTTIKWQDTS